MPFSCQNPYISWVFTHFSPVFHLHKKKTINDENQFFHDKLKYAMSLYKITQNSKKVKIAVFECESALNVSSFEISEENKKLVSDAFNEIKKCKFISDDKKKDLEIKVKNIISK